MASTATRLHTLKPQIDLADSLAGLPPFCTAEQLAERLQVSTDYLYRLAQRAERGEAGGLHTLRMGRKRMFVRSAVAEWLQSCVASESTDRKNAQAVVQAELKRLRNGK